MTPTEQYAQKRAEAVALIKQHAPERLQGSLIDLLRPAIALNVERADDDAITIGASKFGGAPDVPAGFEWPLWNDKPLGFLAQINLEEVALFDDECLLPKSGVLSFFIEFDVDANSYSDINDEDSWRVFSFAGNLERTNIQREVQWKTASISVEAEWTFSEEVPADFDFSLDGEEDQWEDYLEIMPLGHRMFGYTDDIQRSPAEDCETVYRGLKLWSTEADELHKETEKAASGWKLLLQVHSAGEFQMTWGDWGHLFFMIRPEDLAAREFGKACFSFQSH